MKMLLSKFPVFVLALMLLFCFSSSHAATYQLGKFPGSSHFGNADPNTGAVSPYDTLPTSGQFEDEWGFTVGPNSGGAANVTVTGIKQRGISEMAAQLKGVTNGGASMFRSLYSSTTNELQGITFGQLLQGDYSIVVSGRINPNESFRSYSGNLLIDSEVQPTATPIPPSLAMFGVGAIGFMRKDIAKAFRKTKSAVT